MMYKVTIEYVLNVFPSARRIMLATTKEMSKVNYENYLKAGFPIATSDGVGYEYIQMMLMTIPRTAHTLTALGTLLLGILGMMESGIG